MQSSAYIRGKTGWRHIIFMLCYFSSMIRLDFSKMVAWFHEEYFLLLNKERHIAIVFIVLCSFFLFLQSKPQSILYSVLFVFSCFFLIITLAVYILLWNKQTVHGWTLMSYIVSLFFMYMFFLMTHISQFVLKRGPSGGLGDFCKFIGEFYNMHVRAFGKFPNISGVHGCYWQDRLLASHLFSVHFNVLVCALDRPCSLRFFCST